MAFVPLDETLAEIMAVFFISQVKMMDWACVMKVINGLNHA